jgi:hypothetical protein
MDKSVAWCRKCGYHPTLDCVIDLVGEDLEQDAAVVAEPVAKPSAKEGLSLLFKMTPAWIRRCAMAAVTAGLLGVLARMLTDPEGIARMVCALMLLLVAKAAIGTAHVWSFFYAVPESDRLGVGDLFMRPFTIWAPTMRDIELPGVWRRPTLLVFGIVAEVVGLAVVGGIPWDRVWQLGPAEPPKKQLVDSIANVGKAPDAEGSNDPNNPAAVGRRGDCVIIGYVPSLGTQLLGDSGDDIDFSTLVLASDIRGKLTFVGVVTGGVPDEDRAAIRKRLREIARPRPIVPAAVSAAWVEPVLTCRVIYTRMTEDGRFEGLAYDKLLAEVDVR